MHTRTTAGQATVDYLAAIALVATILVVAAPAVGAPDVAGAVVRQFRLALCLAGGDVCSSKQARRDGLAPCPLKSDLTGHEVSVTAFSIEVAHRWALTVTPRSDGSVSIVRTAGGTVGAATGVGAEFGVGPVAFDMGTAAGARGRVQAAFGWEFKNRTEAARFLKHATLNSGNIAGFPPSWVSADQGGDLSTMFGLSAGAKGTKESGQILGFAGGLSGAIGGRKTRDGLYTLYGRAALDAADIVLPATPSIGRGREDWLVEYTLTRSGPHELVFRHGEPSSNGKRLTETVMRLDLRDPANRAVALPLLDASWPWSVRLGARVDAVLGRIRTHGTVETAVSEVQDDTKGLAGSLAGEMKFGAEGKLIAVHKRLVSATARTGGPYERTRYDCVPG